ncbi:hypothetical protein [Loktanella sp. M215]|uniref:hypothetical protein n=1 Tax=Loktanella sp. M215 TaxID=2675431 RepID=UPI001F28C912|nr:hypothetical protein [Loktanella sp. M215]MCF7700591.1 hypothetical protein [Loktanella sp. M215]
MPPLRVSPRHATLAWTAVFEKITCQRLEITERVINVEWPSHAVVTNQFWQFIATNQFWQLIADISVPVDLATHCRMMPADLSHDCGYRFLARDISLIVRGARALNAVWAILRSSCFPAG